MTDFDTRINAIFNAGNERSEKLRALLAAPDDLIALVLRGHLVLEELLFAAAAAHCQDPDHLKAARLRFPQLVSLLRALEKISTVPPRFWDALLELNALRNALAHRLEFDDLEHRVNLFVTAAAGDEFIAKVPLPHSSRQALETTLHFLIGGFEVVAVWHASVEELIRERVRKGP